MMSSHRFQFRRIRRAFRKAIGALWPLRVNQLVYSAHLEKYERNCEVDVKLSVEKYARGPCAQYRAYSAGELVHVSSVFPKVFLLTQFGIIGTTIGECWTHPSHRGLGVYPHVLSRILRELKAERGSGAVYIAVDPVNVASIRGIQRAGFSLYARLSGTRVGPVMLNRRVILGDLV